MTMDFESGYGYPDRGLPKHHASQVVHATMLTIRELPELAQILDDDADGAYPIVAADEFGLLLAWIKEETS